MNSTPRTAHRPCRSRVIGLVILAGVTVGAPLPASAQRTAETIVNEQCGKCHGQGNANAPKPGDKAAWAPRLARGLDALVLAAIRGHGGMPPRGGKAELTDAELRVAILFLFDPAGPPKDLPKSASAPIPPGAGPNRASAGGLDIYLGRVSAERMRAFPTESPEAKLHGGIPGGSGYHHLNVSVFDAGTQTAMTGATVEMDVEQVGMGRQAAKLEPVTLSGGTSFGGYIRLAPKSSYVFTVRVRRPDRPAPVEVSFREKID